MIQKNIKTSIIIPIYNTKEYLEQCVESVLAQTQKEIEIILVDDGSTDGSTQIIQEYESKYSVVKAVYQENQKLGAARNAGIRAASGKYIYFLDSDDYIREDLLEKCYQTAEKERLDFVMFDALGFVDSAETKLQSESVKGNYDRSKAIEGDGKVYSGVEFWDKYFYRGGVYSCAPLMYINVGFLRRNNLYFETGMYYEDMDWMVRMYLYAARLTYIPQQFYYRRYRTDSIMTAEYSDLHLRSCMMSCRKMMGMLSEAQELSWQNMLIPILTIMFERFEEIFKIYCEEARLDKIRPEIMAFYRYLLVDIGPCIKNEDFQMFVLKMLEIIKAGLQDYDSEMNSVPLSLDEYKRQMVSGRFRDYSLDIEGESIGIYGSGVICERFLSMYQQFIGKIAAKIFFIDSVKQSGGSFWGYPLYNVKDIGELKADSIIIASNRYKEEILENIRKYCPKEVNIKYIPEILKFSGAI